MLRDIVLQAMTEMSTDLFQFDSIYLNCVLFNINCSLSTIQRAVVMFIPVFENLYFASFLFKVNIIFTFQLLL